MSAMRVGDDGTEIEVTITDSDGSAIDISQAASLFFYLKKPGLDGEVLTRVPEFSTDGTDGKARYFTANNEIDVPGRWQIQAKIIYSNGDMSSSIAYIFVTGNLI